MRISFRAALVTAAAALGLIATSVAPAQAATGYARCASGKFCVFDGAGGQGAMTSYTSPQADLGTWRSKASSVYNRTGYKYACLYSRTNYVYDDAVHEVEVVTAGAAQVDLADFQDSNSHLDNNLGSVRWAHTVRQCEGGNEYVDWSDTAASYPLSPAAFSDLNRDGMPDLLTRTYAGRLYFLGGDGRASLIGAGWNSMTALTRHGDLNGDGAEDLLARDTAGKLWMYPGNGKGAFGARQLIGGGWNTMTAIQAVGDLNGDGKGDLVARDTAGKLWMYPGNGKGWFGARKLIGGGWQVMRAFAGVGDLSGDGRNDLVVSDSSGKLWLYPGNGKGWFGARKMIGTGGWGPFTTLLGVGQMARDAHPDLLAAQSVATGGEIRIYYGRTAGAIANDGGYYGHLEDGDALF
ncbi:FG-GAP-like repeat-containing protein [Actinacidiphila acidipaludis]|uniref:FG-GAP-like repeat-containing protein n=1 Tax=Actinacidiphila acidipaludis TaxID=2873382 RepID=A0ABS7Q6U4_9ACTN|nr:FG-GAP-like repeat-containing protein [Streptomyces acidipaludis]MBY8878870.1 FG-GAP-like repeat-containing protein [Streptomyces acidipaludis]